MGEGMYTINTPRTRKQVGWLQIHEELADHLALDEEVVVILYGWNKASLFFSRKRLCVSSVAYNYPIGNNDRDILGLFSNTTAPSVH